MSLILETLDVRLIAHDSDRRNLIVAMNRKGKPALVLPGGGTMHEDADASRTAEREFHEETGLRRRGLHLGALAQFLIRNHRQETKRRPLVEDHQYFVEELRERMAAAVAAQNGTLGKRARQALAEAIDRQLDELELERRAFSQVVFSAPLSGPSLETGKLGKNDGRRILVVDALDPEVVQQFKPRDRHAVQQWAKTAVPVRTPAAAA